MSIFDEEIKGQDISEEQDETFGKNENDFLENKRKRTRLQQKNNNEDELNNNNIGCILNIPEFISTLNNEENKLISNTDMILFILELCLNSSQFNLKGDNSSRKFWEEVGKLKELSPITKIFKPETLRKYWRLLRNIKKPKKIINILNEHKNLINNENIKLLASINIIYDFIFFPKKGIEFYINKYCGKILDKAKKSRKVKDMSIDEQIDEIISEFEKAFPLMKKGEIVEKLYQNNFDVRNTYLVMKDEKNFGYLSFSESEDEIILTKNLNNSEYRNLALKKGHINIIKRKKFLEGKITNK
jgi:hypothetical protein